MPMFDAHIVSLDSLSSCNNYNIDETLNNCTASCGDLTAYTSYYNVPASLSAPEFIKKPPSIVENISITESLSEGTPLNQPHAHGGLSLDIEMPRRIVHTISPACIEVFGPKNTHEHDVSETPAKFIVGSSISCYDLVSTLGRGSYGTVLLAHQKDDQRRIPYAMKVLRKVGMAPSGTQEILRELKTLGLINQKLLCSDAYSYPRCSDDDGLVFMQRFTESFQNDNYVFIVLVR